MRQNMFAGRGSARDTAGGAHSAPRPKLDLGEWKEGKEGRGRKG